MVKEWRRTNDNCLLCASQVPHDARLEERGTRREFVCPKCGSTMAQGVVVNDGETADGYVPDQVERNAVVGDETTWRRWEAWWTDYFVVAAIHGRVVTGDEGLMRFIKKLYNIYEDH